MIKDDFNLGLHLYAVWGVVINSAQFMGADMTPLEQSLQPFQTTFCGEVEECRHRSCFYPWKLKEARRASQQLSLSVWSLISRIRWRRIK